MKITVGIGATRAGTVEAAARSICRQTWPHWELLVVGQGPDPELRAAGERLAAWDPRISYIHLPQRGLSRARNEAICCARGDIIAFTDDDCEADPEWLAVVAASFAADPSIGLVGGALLASPSRGLGLSACPTIRPVEAVYDPAVQPGAPPAGLDWAGANVALRADVVRRVGLFDPLLGPGATFCAAEDTDYKLRVEALGVRMFTTPRAVVHHASGRRFGLAAVARLSRGYARGAGAVAGKLTAAGDDRGAAWVAAVTAQARRDLLKPGRAAAALYRLPHFLTAYREVLDGYTVDAETGFLHPKPAPAPRSAAREAAAREAAARDAAADDAAWARGMRRGGA